MSLLSLPKERPYLEAQKQVGFGPLMLLVTWEVGPHGLLMGNTEGVMRGKNQNMVRR